METHKKPEQGQPSRKKSTPEVEPVAVEVTSASFCRVCLLKRPNLKPLTNRVDGVMIQEMLYKLCGQKVEVQQNYPSSVCEGCLALLDCAFSFLNMFQQQDERLRSFYYNGPVVERLVSYQDDDSIVDKGMGELLERIKNIFATQARETISKATSTDPPPTVINVGVNTETGIDLIESTVEAESVEEPTNDMLDVEPKESVLENDVESNDPTMIPSTLTCKLTIQHIGMKTDHLGQSDGEEGENIVGRKESPTADPDMKQFDCSEHPQETDDKIEQIETHTAESEEQLAENVESHSRMRPYECVDCVTEGGNVRNFKTASTLHNHSRSHSYPNRCDLCGQRCRCTSLLQTHRGGHCQCDVCGESFADHRKLKEHKVRQHLSGPELKEFLAKEQKAPPRVSKLHEKRCPFPDCDFTANTYESMYVHKRTKHPTVHKCKLCNKTFALMKQLKLHMTLHTGGKPNGRVISVRIFRRASSHREHMEMHKTDSTYVCGVCQKSFKRPRYLQAHLLTHKTNGEQKKQSRQKHKKSKTYALVRYRYKIFDNPEGYTCDVCGETISYRTSFLYHMRNHRHEQLGTFKCQCCNRAFGTRARMERHLRAHTREQPFKCRLCSKTFVYASQLTTHMSRHDNELSHHCELCGKECSNKAMIELHRAMHEYNKNQKQQNSPGVQHAPPPARNGSPL